MRCPSCADVDDKVVDSRMADDGSTIRRRRECTACHRRFTTVETSSLSVVKRSGVVEPFSREKVMSGVRKACQGRPVSDDDLALLAQQRGLTGFDTVLETQPDLFQRQLQQQQVRAALLGAQADLLLALGGGVMPEPGGPSDAGLAPQAPRLRFLPKS